MEKKVIRVNNACIGVELSSGEHNVKFKYSTPYLRQGIIVSMLSLVIIGVIKRKKSSHVKAQGCVKRVSV